VLSVFDIQNFILLAATLALFAIEAWAFVDAVSQRPDAFVAADKQTKTMWLVILGVALAAHMLIWHPIHLLNIAGAVASIVYLVDVRPAVRSLTQN
jgi:asparagine N-glycosylation enzyme membrane subunit Stt3